MPATAIDETFHRKIHNAVLFDTPPGERLRKLRGPLPEPSTEACYFNDITCLFTMLFDIGLHGALNLKERKFKRENAQGFYQDSSVMSFAFALWILNKITHNSSLIDGANGVYILKEIKGRDDEFLTPIGLALQGAPDEAYALALQRLTRRIIVRWHAPTKLPDAVLARVLPVCLTNATDAFRTAWGWSLIDALAPLFDFDA